MIAACSSANEPIRFPKLRLADADKQRRDHYNAIAAYFKDRIQAGKRRGLLDVDR